MSRLSDAAILKAIADATRNHGAIVFPSARPRKPTRRFPISLRPNLVKPRRLRQ